MSIPDFSNKEQVAKSLLALYGQQTSPERATRTTQELNHKGFRGGADADYCSSVSEWLLADKPFTDKQFTVIAKIIQKYRRQLDRLDWGSIPLGEHVLRKALPQTPALKSKGVLDIGPKKVLRFLPNVYPSKQIMSLGFAWHKPYWDAGYFTPSLVQRVQEMFGDITLTPALQEEIELYKEHSALPDDIVRDEVLLKGQKEAIAFLMNNPRCLLGFAPGTGKTVTAIRAADSLDAKRVLIITPKTLLMNWKREIAKWVDQESSIWHGSSSNWRVPDKGWRWAITNYETAIKNVDTLLRIKWDILIIDESVMVKNRKAKRSKALYDFTRAGKIPSIWMLSGSPASRFYDDMFFQLHILDSKRFSSYWRFARTYCLLDTNEWGTSIYGNQPDAAERLQKDLADIYMARTQEQVVDLPDWVFDTYEVPMSPAQYKVYEQMEDNFMAVLGEENTVTAPIVLTQLLRCAQLASNPALLGGEDISCKLDALEELLEFEEGPFIVWVNFLNSAHSVAQRLEKRKYKCAILTGQTPDKARQTIVDRFQDGKIDVLIAHPGVGKFGLTLTRGRTAIYLERSYNGDDYYQSLHRIRRIGTKESPHVINILATSPKGNKTVDHVIDAVLTYRKEQSLELTTGDIQSILEDAIGTALDVFRR